MAVAGVGSVVVVGGRVGGGGVVNSGGEGQREVVALSTVVVDVDVDVT
jgi:hypothetical protein